MAGLRSACAAVRANEGACLGGGRDARLALECAIELALALLDRIDGNCDDELDEDVEHDGCEPEECA